MEIGVEEQEAAELKAALEASLQDQQRLSSASSEAETPHSFEVPAQDKEKLVLADIGDAT